MSTYAPLTPKQLLFVVLNHLGTIQQLRQAFFADFLPKIKIETEINH